MFHLSSRKLARFVTATMSVLSLVVIPVSGYAQDQQMDAELARRIQRINESHDEFDKQGIIPFVSRQQEIEIATKKYYAEKAVNAGNRGEDNRMTVLSEGGGGGESGSVSRFGTDGSMASLITKILNDARDVGFCTPTSMAEASRCVLAIENADNIVQGGDRIFTSRQRLVFTAAAGGDTKAMYLLAKEIPVMYEEFGSKSDESNFKLVESLGLSTDDIIKYLEGSSWVTADAPSLQVVSDIVPNAQINQPNNGSVAKPSGESLRSADSPNSVKEKVPDEKNEDSKNLPVPNEPVGVTGNGISGVDENVAKDTAKNVSTQATHVLNISGTDFTLSLILAAVAGAVTKSLFDKYSRKRGSSTTEGFGESVSGFDVSTPKVDGESHAVGQNTGNGN